MLIQEYPLLGMPLHLGGDQRSFSLGQEILGLCGTHELVFYGTDTHFIISQLFSVTMFSLFFIMTSLQTSWLLIPKTSGNTSYHQSSKSLKWLDISSKKDRKNSRYQRRRVSVFLIITHSCILIKLLVNTLLVFS